MHDNKFTYKVKYDTSTVLTIVSKNSDKLMKMKNDFSKESALISAESYLDKFKSNKSANYKLTEYVQVSNENENMHEFHYEAIASNGIKTGDSIAMEISNDGELIMLAIHEGNEKVALETVPELSLSDAENIANSYIRTKLGINEDIDLGTSSSEYTVWEDRLVIRVEIENVQLKGSEYGYSFYIDAQSGEINFVDQYCSIG